MRAVDTNLLVRLLVRDDAAQVKAAEEFVAGGAWVSQLVLAGTIWVLDTVQRALDHFRARPALGFSDCLVLEIARKAGHLPIGTFDRALSKLEGTQRV
jgi:predicted nucleic-acid-binding protein